MFIHTHTHTHSHTIIGENAVDPPVFPSCSDPPIVSTKQSHSLLIGVTIGSAIAVICFIFIVGASAAFLLYKRAQNPPKDSLDATSHAAYSHLYQGIMVISMGSQKKTMSCTHTHTHTLHSHTHAHTHTHTIHNVMHTHSHTCTHTHTHESSLIHSLTCTHTHTHLSSLIHSHTHAHTHTHTHVHTISSKTRTVSVQYNVIYYIS